MKMKHGSLLLLLACLTAATGCSNARPYQYQDEKEQPKGPGLLTGESGVFGTAPAGLDGGGCQSGSRCSPGR